MSLIRKPQTLSNQSEDVVARPIEVLVGYDWSCDETGNGNGLNRHWEFLRDEIKSATETLELLAKKQEGAPNPLRVSVKRLRARHGSIIVAEIIRRIKDADILIFDVSGGNRNVYFELGCALSIKGLDSESIFIFSNSSDVGSDLSGLMLTKYEISTDESRKKIKFAKLKDNRGFKAALISSLKQIAISRRMFGKAMNVFEADEEIPANIP